MKFSIVTPALNMEPWIARTIESVLSQAGAFEIEYIIIADPSSDSTVAIAESYQQHIEDGSYPISCERISMHVVVTKHTGMYDAINHGFSEASGDIYAWINADDTYQSGAFQAITTALTAFPDIEWIKGITDTIDDSWHTIRAGACREYRRDWLKDGIYGQESYYIEQDSCFWTAALWKKTGPIPPSYRRAGDYWLWLSFAQHTPLHSLNVPISNFMKRKGQLSREIEEYKTEQKKARPHRPITAWKARLFFSLASRLGLVFQNIFISLYPILFARLPFEYIYIENGHAYKRYAHSFIV